MGKSKIVSINNKLLIQNFENIFQDSTSDVTVNVGIDKLKAILSNTSNYFKENLNQSEITIEEKDDKLFKALIEFSIEEDSYFDFIFLAEKVI
jgi:hypothetical protein